jgi:hypothetical protein
MINGVDVALLTATHLAIEVRMGSGVRLTKRKVWDSGIQPKRAF